MSQATAHPPVSQIPRPVTAPVPSPSTPPPQKRRAGRGKWLIVIGLFLIAAAVMAPLAAKWAINSVLKNRFASTIALKQLGFNPITGKLVLSVRENDHLVLDRHQMEWDWLPLFRHTLRLNDIHLKDLTVEVKRFPDGSVQIGDIFFKGTVKKATEVVNETSSWVFPVFAEVRQVVLENVNVKYTDPPLQATLAFDRLELKAAGSPGAAFLRMGLWKNMALQLDFSGDLRVSGLQAKLPLKPGATVTNKSSAIEKLQGLTALISGLAKCSGLHAELNPGPKPGSWQPVIRVASMQLTDDAAFRLQGKGFRAPLDVTFQPVEFQLKNLDTAHPEETTSVTFETAAGGRSKIRADMSGKPLEQPLSVAGSAQIARLEVPPFSPLMERFAGYRVRTGALNLDTDVSVKRGVLDSKSNLVLNRFEVQKLDTAERDPVADDLGLPLESALPLLKDKNGDIQLEIPVKADLNDPDQAMSSVVSAAISSGFSSALRASMNKVFSPISSGKRFQLDPLTFAPGEATLSAKAKQYLKEVAHLLLERSGVTLKIRGFGPAADQTLIAQRAENVKTHLTTDYPIPPKRLRLSPPEFIDDPAAARVELSL